MTPQKRETLQYQRYAIFCRWNYKWIEMRAKTPFQELVYLFIVGNKIKNKSGLPVTAITGSKERG